MWTQQNAQEEDNVETQRRQSHVTARMHLQTKDCQQTQKATVAKESMPPSKGAWPADILLSDFEPPELLDCTFPLY